MILLDKTHNRLEKLPVCTLTLADMSSNRLDFAKKLGAHHTVLVDGSDAEALAQKIEGELKGKPDVTMECSGAEAAIQTAIYVSDFLTD